MSDYNIYIRGSGFAARENNPTKAWSNSYDDTETETSGGGFLGAFQNITDFAQSPDSLIQKGVGFLRKAMPAVLVAAMVYKLADGIITTSAEFATNETGDYRFITAYENFKASAQMVFRPFSTTLNYFRSEQVNRVHNYKVKQHRDLLGDSVINSYTNKGV